ncbi:unnamed protein product [Rhizophagus irregularis]|nr:unnamed protein product [Rhizophagus irregularis]
MMVALKELNNSKNITPEELNELKIFYDFAIRHQNSSIMCWHSDPNKRPTATELRKKIVIMKNNEPEYYCDGITKIVKSPDIGPVKSINPGAIYKSRSLSEMIKSAESTRSLESIDSEISNNKFEDNLTINDNDYLTKEIELDIDNDTSFGDSKDDDYVTEEINFDI